MPDFNSKTAGREGEDLAAAFLEERGFSILDRNYRYKKYGEIDLVVRRENLLIFVEVKSRSKETFGGPLYSITEKKKKTIRFIASQYLVVHPEVYKKGIICRFDMIAIMDGRISWVEDIFR